jgi:hypothetical protein
MINTFSLVGGLEITTIESIGATELGGKVKQASLALDVLRRGLLPRCPDPSGDGAADVQIETHRLGGHRCSHVGQHLPLRHLHSYPRRHRASRGPNLGL